MSRHDDAVRQMCEDSNGAYRYRDTRAEMAEAQANLAAALEPEKPAEPAEEPTE